MSCNRHTLAYSNWTHFNIWPYLLQFLEQKRHCSIEALCETAAAHFFPPSVVFSLQYSCHRAASFQGRAHKLSPSFSQNRPFNILLFSLNIMVLRPVFVGACRCSSLILTIIIPLYTNCNLFIHIHRYIDIAIQIYMHMSIYVHIYIATRTYIRVHKHVYVNMHII